MSLQNLTKLEIINVNNFNLQNLINNLKELIIKDNNKIIDLNISKLVYLESLELHDCSNLNGTFLNNLQNLTSLTLARFNLENIKLSKNIKKLNLIETNINDEQLNDLLNLESLALVNENNINGSFLQNVTKLNKLSIIECELFQGEYLINLKNSLKGLKIYDCSKIEGYHLQNLQYLKYLNIENNEITDNDIKNLLNLKYLICDDIEGTCLLNFTKLKILKTKSFTSDDFLKNCKQLQYFRTYFYRNLNGTFLNELQQFKNVSIGITNFREYSNNEEDEETFEEFKERADLDNGHVVPLVCWVSEKSFQLLRKVEEKYSGGGSEEFDFC